MTEEVHEAGKKFEPGSWAERGDAPRPGWTLFDWRAAFIDGALSESALRSWWESLGAGGCAWIHQASLESVLARYGELTRLADSSSASVETHPLLGVPFAVKDNIDVDGWPTTAACPAFSKTATRHATVVRLLLEAGAVVVGKTNLDQFATGLVGTRSPYGIVSSAFDPDYIAGGSSSGSAHVVTRGLVPFSLGTDTAGSGRVPAAFCNIVGLKPTRGTFSTSGVVPACRTLDCVSVFTQTVTEAELVAEILRQADSDDPYSRAHVPANAEGGPSKKVLGVLEPLEFFGDGLAERAYLESIDRVREAGFELQTVSSEPFFRLAALLYGGPWVVERVLAAGSILDQPETSMDPVVRSILLGSRDATAADCFRAEYERAKFAAAIAHNFSRVSAIVVPTTGTTFRIDEVASSPLETNSKLGMYTNFTNLADLSALAVPGCWRQDGLPTGLTILGPAFADPRLVEIGERIHRATGKNLGATDRSLASVPARAGSGISADSGSRIAVAVVGAHLSNMALNHQLTDRGATLREETQTAPRYRLFALFGTKPEKPGLMRQSEGQEGRSIVVEVWEMSPLAFAEFTREVPPPLGIGNVELVDGSWVKGFICEPSGFEGAEDITSFGGFRAYAKKNG